MLHLSRYNICREQISKYTNVPGIVHYRVLLHLIGFIKGNPNKGIKFYQDVFKIHFYLVLSDNNIKVSRGSIIAFTDSSWNDCVNTGRSTGGYITMIQPGVVDYRSQIPVPVAISSGEAKYISAAVACMHASRIRMLVYDLKFFWHK